MDSTKHRLDKFKRGGRSRSKKADQASLLKLANGGIAGLSVNVLGGAPGLPSIPQVSMMRGNGVPTPGKLTFPQQQTLMSQLAQAGNASNGLNALGSMLPGPGGTAATDSAGLGGWGLPTLNLNPGSVGPLAGQARGGRAFADGGRARTSAKRRIAKT